jgi:hypothetical protein
MSLDYVCSSVFRPETGIIAFLKKVGHNKDLSVSSAVKDVLEFIARFMEKRKKYPVFQLYAKDLKVRPIKEIFIFVHTYFDILSIHRLNAWLSQKLEAQLLVVLLSTC